MDYANSIFTEMDTGEREQEEMIEVEDDTNYDHYKDEKVTDEANASLRNK